MKIGLCLLTMNEIHGCRHDVPRLPLEAFEEVFALDGGSRDGTVEYLESCGIPVIQQESPSYNGAYLDAFRHTQADALVLYHPKGSIDAEAVLRFRRFFEEGFDVVIASRMCSGARNEEDDRLLRPRKWFVLGLGALARLGWKRSGPTMWDVLHGFRGLRRDAFFALEPLSRGTSIDLEIVVRAYRLGLACVEFPVIERPRLHGATHFPAFKTGRHLLGYLLRELLRSSPQPAALGRATGSRAEAPALAEEEPA